MIICFKCNGKGYKEIFNRNTLKQDIKVCKNCNGLGKVQKERSFF